MWWFCGFGVGLFVGFSSGGLLVVYALCFVSGGGFVVSLGGGCGLVFGFGVGASCWCCGLVVGGFVCYLGVFG